MALNFNNFSVVNTPATKTVLRGEIDCITWEKDSDESPKTYRIDLRTNEPVKVPGKDRRTSLVPVWVYMHECIEGGYIEVCGNWKLSEIYGTSFDASHTRNGDYATYVDDDEDGAMAMLKLCFGPKRASMVVDHLDDSALDAWNLFKTSRDEFERETRGVRGIGPKTIESAYIKYADHMGAEVLFRTFKKYGMDMTDALQIFEAFGINALDTIQKNPYKLSKIMGFWKADSIALKHYHVAKDDARRVNASIMSVMHEQESSGGHTFMRLRDGVGNVPTLLGSVSRTLHIDESHVSQCVNDLTERMKLRMDKQGDKYGLHDIVYLPKFYNAEVNLAKNLKAMIRGSSQMEEDFIKSEIETYEEAKSAELSCDFRLADAQKQAVLTSCRSKFSIISGAPGTGKTTIIDCICNVFKAFEPHTRISLCAPTGKAAKRMTESTGMEASTVHRLLRYDPETGDFTFNSKNPLDADVIIADECSMMGVCLCDSLIDAVNDHATVIFVGDKDQLPSVDAGQVLADMLAVNSIPKTILTDIKRQDDGSTVLNRAFDISGALGHEPKMPDLSPAHDFHFYEIPEIVHGAPEEWLEGRIKYIKDNTLELFKEQVDKYGIENVLFMIPQNRGGLGVNDFNPLIQDIINPELDDKPELKIGRRVYRVGDRVIQLENEDDYNVYNGMIGVITSIFKDEETGRDTIEVDFGDDVIVDYQRDRFDKFKLAYALTIHKCQGSEAKSIILLIAPEHSRMATKKLIYTGLTRCRTECNLVSTYNTIYHASMTSEAIRLSMLRNRLNFQKN